MHPNLLVGGLGGSYVGKWKECFRKGKDGKKEDIPTGQFVTVSCGIQVPSKKVSLIHQKIITDK